MTEPATKGRAAPKPDETQAEAAQAQQVQEAMDAYGDLAKAIVWVTGQIKSVPKNGKNEFHNYNYATKDDIIEALKPLMEQAGLAVVPHFRGAERGPEDDRGYVDLFANWEMQIIHRSGSVMPVAWHSESMDNSDKNFNKAVTAAKKSFYRALFDIPDGEPDAEHTSNAVTRQGGEGAGSGGSSRQARGVGVRQILDYVAQNNIPKQAQDWVLTRPAVGAEGGTLFKDLPKDKLPAVMEGLQQYVAERASRDPETGEARTAAPADDPGPYPSSASPADDGIPF